MKEALKLAYDYIDEVDYGPYDSKPVLAAIKAALAQTEQEPVAWMSPSWIDPDTRGWQSDSFESIPIEGWLPIYTTPPQRTWVGLTYEEETELIRLAHNHAGIRFYIQATEAKLKEKNS